MAYVRWYGDEVKARMRAACVVAIDKTMANCVTDARAGHDPYPPPSEPYERWHNRLTFLTNSLMIFDGASPVGLLITGSWGARADTAVYLEIGTSRKGSGFPRAAARAESAAGDMNAIPPPSAPPQMAERPAMRPAANREYPLLGLRIAAAFNGLELP